MDGYNYPWSNLHELNLDWMLEKMKNITITSQQMDDIADMYNTLYPWITRNVIYYGAKADGVTDDTQAFLDCAANEDIIIIPSGTYLVSNPIFNSISNKVFIGFPRANIKVLRKFDVNNSDHILFENIDFVKDANAPQYNKAVQFYRCMDVAVVNCSANGFYSVGFDFVTTGRAYVKDCWIHHVNPLDGTATGAGVQFYYESGYSGTEYVTTEHVVQDCRIHDCGIDGVLANTNNVVVTGCTLYNNGKSVVAAGVYANGRNNIRVNDCLLYSNTGNGIDIVGSYEVMVNNITSNDNGCAGVYIGGGGNVILTEIVAKSNGASSSGYPNQDSGIVTDDYNNNSPSNVHIANCELLSNVGYGLRMQTGSPYINSVHCYGNTQGSEYVGGNYYLADYTYI